MRQVQHAILRGHSHYGGQRFALAASRADRSAYAQHLGNHCADHTGAIFQLEGRTEQHQQSTTAQPRTT